MSATALKPIPRRKRKEIDDEVSLISNIPHPPRQGTVINYHHQWGYGRISAEDGSVICVEWHGVKSQGHLHLLLPGVCVTFDVFQKDEHSPRAVNVVIVSEEPATTPPLLATTAPPTAARTTSSAALLGVTQAPPPVKRNRTIVRTRQPGGIKERIPQILPDANTLKYCVHLVSRLKVFLRRPSNELGRTTTEILNAFDDVPDIHRAFFRSNLKAIAFSISGHWKLKDTANHNQHNDLTITIDTNEGDVVMLVPDATVYDLDIDPNDYNTYLLNKATSLFPVSQEQLAWAKTLISRAPEGVDGGPLPLDSHMSSVFHVLPKETILGDDKIVKLLIGRVHPAYINFLQDPDFHPSRVSRDQLLELRQLTNRSYVSVKDIAGGSYMKGISETPEVIVDNIVKNVLDSVSANKERKRKCIARRIALQRQHPKSKIPSSATADEIKIANSFVKWLKEQPPNVAISLLYWGMFFAQSFNERMLGMYPHLIYLMGDVIEIMIAKTDPMNKLQAEVMEAFVSGMAQVTAEKNTINKLDSEHVGAVGGDFQYLPLCLQRDHTGMNKIICGGYEQEGWKNGQTLMQWFEDNANSPTSGCRFKNYPYKS